MINLLPADNRKQLRSSYTNTILLKYVVFFIGTMIAVVVSIAVIYINLLYTKGNIEQQLTDLKQRSQLVMQPKQQAEKLQNDLTEVDKIFSKQVHYSNFLVALAKGLPSDVAIQNLDINETSLKAPIIIRVTTVNHDQILNTKRSLENQKFIDSVQISSIAHNEKTNRFDGILILNLNKKGLEETLQWRKK
jgi:hypothetical protein